MKKPEYTLRRTNSDSNQRIKVFHILHHHSSRVHFKDQTASFHDQNQIHMKNYDHYIDNSIFQCSFTEKVENWKQNYPYTTQSQTPFCIVLCADVDQIDQQVDRCQYPQL